MDTKLALLSTLLLIIVFINGINGKVELGFNELKHVVKQSGTGNNGTILQNKDVHIVTRCGASYPTEWILDDDKMDDNYRHAWRVEWTDRKFQNSIEETTYNYWVLLLIQFPVLVSTESFICRAVGNHHDSLIIDLTPNGDTVTLTTKVGPNNYATPPTQAPTCDFMFSFMYVPESGYYARCSSTLAPQAVPTVVNYDCTFSAAYCANTFRTLKMFQNKCTELITGYSQRISEGWMEIGGNRSVVMPGTVVCTIQGERAAQEYFFTAPNKVTGERNIQFTWSAIQPNQMIWMKPSTFDPKYFIGQTLSVSCIIPKYGFSYDPVLLIKINGTTSAMVRKNEEGVIEDHTDRTWKVPYVLRLRTRGKYEINCTGAVWNTTEWATKAEQFDVIEPVAPYFEKPTESFEFVEGDNGKEILCDALGDPKPNNVEWMDGHSLPGIKARGHALTFLAVTNLVHGEYTCKATNTLGQSATKTFSVHVNSRTSNTAAIAAGVSVVVVILIVLGMAYVYFKLKTLNKIVSGLTTKEILEFQAGKKITPNNVKTPADFIESLPYNRSYELPRSRLVVDTSTPLGSGAYGIVFKGTVKTEHGEIAAAFKTIKQEADISYFKALLSELKILIHVGHHESIVNLIGACTGNIKNREVYVAVELCQFCLWNFLRDNSSAFLNYVKDGETLNQPILNTGYENVGRPFSTFTLVKWATEIGSALEYIASKHLIHADIATRNILLSFNLDAKLCDFGLARQLVDYNYIKSEQCPLPWKWMAIESLRQLNFSTKSDVWAYGVTLWEMFSLGDIPYPGLNWSIDFANQLERGLRLTQPIYCPKSLWEVIFGCWHNNPESRPTFKYLRESLEKFQLQYLKPSVN